MHNKCALQYLFSSCMQWNSEKKNNKQINLSYLIRYGRKVARSIIITSLCYIYLFIQKKIFLYTDSHTCIEFIRPFDIILSCQLSWEQLKDFCCPYSKIKVQCNLLESLFACITYKSSRCFSSWNLAHFGRNPPLAYFY